MLLKGKPRQNLPLGSRRINNRAKTQSKGRFFWHGKGQLEPRTNPDYDNVQYFAAHAHVSTMFVQKAKQNRSILITRIGRHSAHAPLGSLDT